MVRTQIQLTEDQARRLRELAAARGLSMAEIVRRALDELLQRDRAPDPAELRQRALEALGSFASGVDDLASEHDRYFVESVTE